MHDVAQMGPVWLLRSFSIRGAGDSLRLDREQVVECVEGEGNGLAVAQQHHPTRQRRSGASVAKQRCEVIHRSSLPAKGGNTQEFATGGRKRYDVAIDMQTRDVRDADRVGITHDAYGEQGLAWRIFGRQSDKGLVEVIAHRARRAACVRFRMGPI